MKFYLYSLLIRSLIQLWQESTKGLLRQELYPSFQLSYALKHYSHNLFKRALSQQNQFQESRAMVAVELFQLLCWSFFRYEKYRYCLIFVELIKAHLVKVFKLTEMVSDYFLTFSATVSQTSPSLNLAQGLVPWILQFQYPMSI